MHQLEVTTFYENKSEMSGMFRREIHESKTRIRQKQEREKWEMGRLFLGPEGFMLLGGTLMLHSTGFMIRGKDVRTRFCGVTFVNLPNEFISMHEVHSSSPLEFFVGALIAHPLDVVE